MLMRANRTSLGLLDRGRSPVPAVVAVAGLLVLNLIVVTGWPAPLRAVIGFPVAAVLPGALTIRALRITGRTGWNWLLLAVTLSLAWLLAIGLCLGLLPGAALNPIGSLLALDLVIAALAVAAVLCARRWPAAGAAPELRVTPSGGAGSGAGIAAVALGAVAVILTVLGANRLNAGGTGSLTATGLAVAAAALAAAVLAGRRHRVTAAATGVYLVALAVLLATSLRGIGVTGHDIKVEYRVLLATLDSGSWRPNWLFVGYNSCLSITVLPAFLARLLGLAAVDVFRVCFQVLFAMVPVGVFLLARRRLACGTAVCAAGLFIAFPAFVNDMPMLNRQEIALIFFTVLLGALFDVDSPRWQRATLFVVAAAGMTVSHYSSTYITAVLLTIGWAARFLRRRWPARAGTAGTPPRQVLGLGRPAIAVTLMALAWAVLSGSAATLATGLYQAASAVVDRASVSADAARYSMFTRENRPLTDSEALARYATVVRQSDSLPPGTLAPPPECAPRLLPSDTLATTSAGAALSRAGVPPEQLNDAARGAAVLLFQGGGVAGCIILWCRRRREATEALAHLAAGSLALLALAVVAPQLTDSYGLLRLYQQFLVLLAPLIMLSITVPVGWLGARAGLTAAIAGSVAVGCLLTTSGLIPQLTGGYVPQLNLNNAGPYFRAYYGDHDDLSEASWVRRHLRPDAYVVTDARDSGNLRGLTRIYPQEGLVPGAVPSEAHVGLTISGGSADAVAVAGERVLRYTFPVSCVAAGRPLVHETTRYRLYGPVEQS
jgi:uncharacterized membrane protein